MCSTMDTFDVMSSDHFHAILHSDKEHGLLFNRLDGAITTINYSDAKELSNLKLVGRTHGIIGRYLDHYLVLIKICNKVGTLFDPTSRTEHDIYVINQVQVIDLSHSASSKKTASAAISIKDNSVKYNATSTYGQDLKEQHGSSEAFSSLPITISTSCHASGQRSTNWMPFKLSNPLKSSASSQPNKSSQSDTSTTNNETPGATSSRSAVPQDESDQRLVEEMIKLFNNTNSFYFSPTLDLTNSFSRNTPIKRIGNESAWRSANEQYFWNKHMLKDLIELSKQDSDANYFISVILQGYISIEHISSQRIDINNGGGNNSSVSSINMVLSYRADTNTCSSNSKTDTGTNKSRPEKESVNLALVSRRSVYQAGTRYRRRGCDEAGNCANFVETEQILWTDKHFKSFVSLRGSIPLFWHQSGYNYRPPPILTRSDDENYHAFCKHFIKLIQTYNTERILVVDCTEQTGREKALHEAYKKNMEKFSQRYPLTRLIEFDFHKHCRGRQCTDTQVAKHLESCGLTGETLREVKYYWNDGDVVSKQASFFRVNCLDCSDRTNLVQRTIALMILDLQLAKLAIISPDTNPEENQIRMTMQSMWSTNGNVLSTQYCGTRALFTCGDRKLAGYLKDTYSSASRYYMSKFRDAYRQAAIDAMLGIESVECENLKSGNLNDQYELLTFDPILVGRSGSALLKDVGNMVSNRLSRLKGRLYAGSSGRGFGLRSRHGAEYAQQSEMTETGFTETLAEMSIDWPSSESFDQLDSQEKRDCVSPDDVPVEDLFAHYTNIEDNFQDDDLGQMMLSIDLAELQHLRESEKQTKEDEQHRDGSKSSDKAHVGDSMATAESESLKAGGLAAKQNETTKQQ